jgi:hypothetical protein
MKGKRKTPKTPGLLRWVVAENIKHRMADVYHESPNRTLSLARDSRVSHSTVQRIVGAQTGASLDNLEAIAGALKLQTYQLLIPDERFVMSAKRDPTNPLMLFHQTPARYSARRAK